MVKFLILILNKSYYLTLHNNALIFVFFVIVMLELRGIVECAVPRLGCPMAMVRVIGSFMLYFSHLAAL